MTTLAIILMKKEEMTMLAIILVVMFLLCLANYNFRSGGELANSLGLIIGIIVSLITVFGCIMALLGRLRPF